MQTLDLIREKYGIEDLTQKLTWTDIKLKIWSIENLKYKTLKNWGSAGYKMNSMSRDGWGYVKMTWI